MTGPGGRARNVAVTLRLNEAELAALRWLQTTEAATANDVIRALITRAAEKGPS